MTTTVALTVMLGLSLLAGVSAASLSPKDSPLTEGARIRFWTPRLESNPNIAEIIHVRSSELVIALADQEVKFKLRFNDIAKVEVSVGGGHNYTGLFAVIGAVAVGTLSALYNEGIKNASNTGPTGEAFFGGMFVGGAVGALVGWVLSSGEKWEEVPDAYYGEDFGREGTPGPALVLRISF